MVVMSESSDQDEPRLWWKEAIKRRIVGSYSAALVGGQHHRDYLVELGMPRERIFTGYDIVDNEYFGRRTSEIRDSESEIRSKHKLPENYFLASGRFIEKKNLTGLIAAYAKYRQKARTARSMPWDLVVLGDGPLLGALHAQLSTLDVREHVHLPGFKPYDQLPIYYALANGFVHASTTEQWGLVVNEAVASGLPVIISNRCGCAPELVSGNGFTFDPTNQSELTARLLDMASLSDQERTRLRDRSYRIAASFVPERFRDGLQRAVNVAMENPQKRFGMMDRALLLVTASYAR